MHPFWRHSTAVAWMLAVPLVPPAWSADCTITVLQWSADGTTLHCTAGDSTRQEPLHVDVASASVTCDAPRVADPSWNPVTQRVLWHDGFGVYEMALDTAQPRPLVFLPEQSSTFLRALGCDTHGALLWTITRDTG